MLSVIGHRGPDESGIYTDENFGMGSVRLSIVDIVSGQQPMSDESGNYWIVYNGEIFNYDELKNILIKKGIKLRTHCDTEIVVQMYAVFGDQCLQYFNGQFAFCIWNRKEKELFFARDRVGIRPLYYWKQGNSFAFCSEIKGLFTLDRVERVISHKSLSQIFTFWSTISSNTPFENIYEVPPGCCMVVGNSDIKIKKYWTLDFPIAGNHYMGSMEDAAEELRELLTDAVKIRLRADVPVAAYLSGGLDSSITTSIIKEVNPGVLNTFSIGFGNEDFDETTYQQLAVKYFNTHHIAFKCTNEEISENFPATIWHTEYPILRTSPVPMFLLSKKVRQQNIKVVVTGEGADEFLAGYNIFKESKVRRFWANQPGSTIRPKLLTKLYPYLTELKRADRGGLGLKMFFGYKLTDTDNLLYSHLLRWHNTAHSRNYFSDPLKESLSRYDPLEELQSSLEPGMKNWSDLSQAQYLEASIFMSKYLLSSQGDRVSMAHSVEGRYPFLDHRVIEFCNQLPDHFKLNCLNEKFLLKKMSKGMVPENITKRTKQPYRAPIKDVFINSGASPEIAEILSESKIKDYGLFDPIKVKLLKSKFDAGHPISEIDQMAITGIISTQLLSKMFIKDG